MDGHTKFNKFWSIRYNILKQKVWNIKQKTTVTYCKSTATNVSSMRYILIIFTNGNSFSHFWLANGATATASTNAGSAGGDNPPTFGSFAESWTNVSHALFFHWWITLSWNFVCRCQRWWWCGSVGAGIGGWKVWGRGRGSNTRSGGNLWHSRRYWA